MQKKEKLIGILLLSIVGIFVIFLLVQGVVVKPIKEIDKQTNGLKVKLKKLKDEQKLYQIADKEVKDAAGRMYSSNLDKANGMLGGMLNDLIDELGLDPRKFTRAPVGPNRMRGAKEIGWAVQGEGSLEKLVDMLYKLDKSEALHRIDGLKFSPAKQPGDCKINFRYMTLVLDPAPSGIAGTNTALADLSAIERDSYQGIVDRDIFRGYVKYVPPAAPAQNNPQQAAPQGPPPFRPEIYKAVSLSTWGGKDELHILNTENWDLRTYTVGDQIEAWQIIGFDYTRKPLPGSILESDSRAILRKGTEYWVLEFGQTLAQLYQINADALPAELKQESK